MKFLAITLLAVCLIQGNSAQLSGLRSLVSNAASGARNAASGAVNAASNVASGTVVGTALNTASGIRSRLSGGAQALLDSASADVSVDSLTEAAKSLTPNELLETVQGAASEVNALATAAQNQLQETVNSVSQQAEAALNATTSGWNCPVQAALKKALAAGVDVRECAVDGVVELGKNSVTSAVSCVTDKVKEAITLGKNIAGLPIRAATLAKDGVSGVRSCSTKSNTLIKRACQATKIAPVAVKSALLVKDAVSYTTQAATLITTLKTKLTACAAGVAAKSGAQAALTAGKIATCVAGKIAGN